jgi:hypothetical protein
LKFIHNSLVSVSFGAGHSFVFFLFGRINYNIPDF